MGCQKAYWQPTNHHQSSNLLRSNKIYFFAHCRTIKVKFLSFYSHHDRLAACYYVWCNGFNTDAEFCKPFYLPCKFLNGHTINFLEFLVYFSINITVSEKTSRIHLRETDKHCGIFGKYKLTYLINFHVMYILTVFSNGKSKL